MPKGARLLGMHVGEATGETYGDALVSARAAGAEIVSLSFNWDTLETGPGTYDPTLLDIANAYYPPLGVKLLITLRPLDTNGKHFPADIAALAFDHPTVIARFQAFLDWVFSRIPAVDLPIMGVGNEIDVLLGTNATLWAQWKTLFDAAIARIHTLRSGTQVGMIARYPQVLSPEYATASAGADAVMVTYYPLNADFTVQTPDVVTADFAALAAPFAKPVHVVEAGYPTSATCGSSDEFQRQFVAALFAAWDAQASKIASMFYSILTDYSTAEMAALAAYYGSSNPVLLEFVRTIGLRTDGPVNKSGYAEHDAQAAARGW